VCHSIGQQHREIWHASGVWRRNDRRPGPDPRGNWCHPSRFAQSVATFDKYPARLRARYNWTYNSRRADYQLGHETAGDTRIAWRQSSAAAVNAGGERGYVYQQKDKYLAGMRPLAAFRCLCAADLRALTSSISSLAAAPA